jgi:hypothetical protein
LPTLVSHSYATTRPPVVQEWLADIFCHSYATSVCWFSTQMPPVVRGLIANIGLPHICHQCLVVFHSYATGGPKVTCRHWLSTHMPSVGQDWLTNIGLPLICHWPSRSGLPTLVCHSYATSGPRVASRHRFATHMPPVSVGLPLRSHWWSESGLSTLVCHSYAVSGLTVAN